MIVGVIEYIFLILEMEFVLLLYNVKLIFKCILLCVKIFCCVSVFVIMLIVFFIEFLIGIILIDVLLFVIVLMILNKFDFGWKVVLFLEKYWW